MATVKKLIVKLKNWLILKLGGYVYPMSEVKVCKTNVKPIPLYATFEISEYSADWLCMSPEQKSGIIERNLLRKITDEIQKNHLYEIDTYYGYNADREVYRIKCLVLDPFWEVS